MKRILKFLAAFLLAQPTRPRAAGAITNSIGMKLMPLAPGSFKMGQDGPPLDVFNLAWLKSLPPVPKQ